MDANTITGKIKVEQNISTEMVKAQNSTKDYITVVKELEGDIKAVEKQKISAEVDASSAKKAAEEVKNLKDTTDKVDAAAASVKIDSSDAQKATEEVEGLRHTVNFTNMDKAYVHFDSSKVEKTKEQVEDVKEEIDKVSATAASVTIDASDVKKATEETEKLDETINSVGAETANVNIDDADAKAAKEQVEDVKEEIDKVDGQKARAKMDVDASAARKEIESVKRKISSIVATIGVTAVVKSAVTTGLDYNKAIEQSQISWDTILGNAVDATAQIDTLKNLAAHTPFQFAGLDTAAKKLSMAGFSGNELTTALTNVGDAVSAIGGGQAELEGVSTALFQIYTKGKLSAEEMLQLAERGIPAWQILADKMGVSTAELQKMTEQGQLMSNEVLPMLISGMGDKYSGAMDAQSQSMAGLMSTAKDLYTQFMGDVTGNMFDTLKGTITDLNGAMSDGSLNAYAVEIGSALGKATEDVVKLAKALWDNKDAVLGVVAGFVAYKAATAAGNFISAMIVSFGTLKDVITGVKTATEAANAATAASPWGIVALAIGAVTAGIVAMTSAAKEAEAPLTDVKDRIQDIEEAYKSNVDSAQTSYNKEIANVQLVQDQVKRVYDMIDNNADDHKIDLAVQDLVKQFPELEGAIKKVNGEWKKQNDLVNETAESIIRSAEIEFAKGKLDSAVNAKATAQTELDTAKTNRQTYINENPELYKKYTEATANQKKYADDAKEAYNSLEKIKASGASPLSKEYIDANAKYVKADSQYVMHLGDNTGHEYDKLKGFDRSVVIAEQEYMNADSRVKTETKAYNDKVGEEDTQDKSEPVTSDSQYTADIMKTLNASASPIMQAYNAAYGYIKQGNMSYGLQYANQSGISMTDKEIDKADGSKTKAFKLLDESMKEAVQGTLIETKAAADQQLKQYGEDMSTTERESLTTYSKTISDALNTSSKTAGESMATALSWLKTWKLPVDIKVTTSDKGVQVDTGYGNGSYTPTDSTRKNAAGDPYYEGGETWVGEEGPEKVKLPKGSEITPAWKAKGNMEKRENTGGKVYYITIGSVNAHNKNEVDELLDKLMDRLDREDRNAI